MLVKTITLTQICDLKWARDRAKEWRGNHNPNEWDDFDQWIDDVNIAIKAVELDRKTLRSILTGKVSIKVTPPN